ncbi:uncharacterized protein LOC108154551 isoform X2 [Drosophila miranda]|uniref:uncharacterized protein LOC108154551 isoform X2 n=1 Tax=Drosophila miranda TaxID=7229 RepID=UPI0007E839DC|nr:uncharacterized protein LOC108154551 isoform X2 [Drosophila miranda]
MHPIIFLILATTIVVTTHTLTPNRTDYLETMECGDCEKVNQECKIVSSGYYCREHDDSDKLDARQEVEAELLHLRNCMGPDHFFFIEAQREFRRPAVFGHKKWDASKSKTRCAQSLALIVLPTMKEALFWILIQWAVHVGHREKTVQKIRLNASFSLLFFL